MGDCKYVHNCNMYSVPHPLANNDGTTAENKSLRKKKKIGDGDWKIKGKSKVYNTAKRGPVERGGG